MRENAMRYRPSWKRRDCMVAIFGREPLFQSTRTQRSPFSSSVRNTASIRPRRLTPSMWVSTGYSTAQMRSFHSSLPHSLVAKRSQRRWTEASSSLSDSSKSSSKVNSSCSCRSEGSADSAGSASSASAAEVEAAEAATEPGRSTPTVSSASGASSGSALGATPKCSSISACTAVPIVAAREGR